MTTSPDDLRPAADQGDQADRVTIAELRRQLLVERERSLNATDRVLGAQAEAAQARAEIKELRHGLHVREAELVQAKELLAQHRARAGSWDGRNARRLLDRANAVLGQLLGRGRR